MGSQISSSKPNSPSRPPPAKRRPLPQNPGQSDSEEIGQEAFNVPKSQHHIIVGKGGGTIRHITTESKAQIVIPSDDSSTVTIIGTSSQRKFAKLLIKDHIQARTGQLFIDADDLVKKNIFIPEDVRGQVIGKNGKEIKGIQEECKLLSAHLNASGSLELEGDEESVGEALARIKRIIAHHDYWKKMVDSSYNMIRKQMDECHQKRGEYFLQSQAAFKSGNGAEAKRLSELGKKESEKLEQLEIKGANETFYNLNGRDQGCIVVSGVVHIDLHGQLVKQALRLLEEEIHKQLAAGHTVFKVITGAGNHSCDGALIRPKVAEYLEQVKNSYITQAEKGSFVIRFLAS
eukprot:GCRY01005118.1.p1 GENE.GCRY01005118.1~~GCRY01005118.1.p1  ORF type:complete len:346 (-),score=32.56 GCRY01005118.1:82-1119(-)